MSDSNRLSRRGFLQATGGAAGAAALAGCIGGNGDDGDDGSDDGSGEPQKGGTLQLINSTITTFDPVAAGDAASGYVIQQMFDPLMNYVNGTTTVEKLVAKSYSTNDDFTKYTFELKEGAKYHNGKEVTADDFVYSFERLARSPHAARSYFILSSLNIKHETTENGDYKPGSLAVKAVDDYTLTFELKEAFHSTLAMLAYTSFASIPQNVLGPISEEANENGEPTEAYNDFAKRGPVGSGPFKFEYWKQADEAKVSRFDDYHGKVPYLDAVRWKIIEKSSPKFNYIRNRNADYFQIPTSQYAPDLVNIEETDDKGRKIGTYGPLPNGETVSYARIPEVSTFYFGFNTNNVPKPVRKAVAYITNQKQFANQVFKGRVAPGYHLTPPLLYPGGGNAYTKHAKENYPYGYNETKFDEAKQVMEDAGYGPNNRFPLTFTHYTSETWAQMAGILRDKLGAAYIDLEVESAKFSTLIQRGKNGNLQAYTLGWIADWPAPDNFLQLIYPPRTDTASSSPLTYTNWDEIDSEAKRKAKQAFQKVLDNRQPTDEAQQIRNEAYITMEEANWEDVILVNTFHGVSEPMAYDGVHVDLHGAMGMTRMMHNDSWLEKSQQEQQ